MALVIMAGTAAPRELWADDICAPIFNAGQVARQDFARELKRHPVETDLDAYVGNIDNYDIVLSDNADNYTVRFKLRNDGRAFAGGAADYVVRKVDMKIVSFLFEK